MYAATIELVGEGGYDALTATGIARAAGVSNRTFYENFSGKEDCFAATYELIIRHTVREVLSANRREEGWQAKFRQGMLAFAKEVAEKPTAARLALVEAFACPQAVARMRHTEGLFEALAAETLAADGVETPVLVVKGVVAGAIRVARMHLLTGRESDLSADCEQLTRWAISLFDPAAKQIGVGRPVVDELRRGPTAPSGGQMGAIWTPNPRDERTMILHATSRLAAEDGYDSLTPPRIRAAAGVSRRRFHAHFRGVDDCFLATLELAAARLLAGAQMAYRAAPDWSAGVHRAIVTVCRELAADPDVARLLFLEISSAGRRAVEWRVSLVSGLSSLLRASISPGDRPTAQDAEASVAAAWAVVHHYAVNGRIQRLPLAADTLSYLVLTPSLGAERTAALILAERQVEARNTARARNPTTA
jgi:AcrR family transcriptional regulator